ncbi:hypothetical protein LSH36_44g06033 [Paralvinella palmiformis]|uniref:Uncharacterized protein n=1 Tax=Paralvinella palmiformis TaxID=53620 RepID=A0AAD9K7K5_9ANNE|nr:hypothetical protein LSH36_44g06033 [Paralvinella palmiformis]
MASSRQRPKLPSYLLPTTSSINKVHNEHGIVQVISQVDFGAKIGSVKLSTTESQDHNDAELVLSPKVKEHETSHSGNSHSSSASSDRGAKPLSRREVFKPAGAVSASRSNHQGESNTTTHPGKYYPKVDGSGKIPAKVAKALKNKVYQWAQTEKAKTNRSQSDSELGLLSKPADGRQVMLEMPTELQLSNDSGLSSCEPSSPDNSHQGEQNTGKYSTKISPSVKSKNDNRINGNILDKGIGSCLKNQTPEDAAEVGLCGDNSELDDDVFHHSPPVSNMSVGSPHERLSASIATVKMGLKPVGQANGQICSGNKTYSNAELVSRQSSGAMSVQEYPSKTADNQAKNVSHRIPGERHTV